MSLNGLDDPSVKEAHVAAVAEPGGWFLLKYSSRDEVELLGRGNGGIVEIRNKISQYDENSPLYGFLRYRRRNVIIKFQPEECSRLVQARATVHFNVICEHFSPFDTSFSIANAKELKDTKLSAACSLHAASGSTSSSTSSLRRRRLMEITEEEEDEERDRKRQSVLKEEERPFTAADGQDTALPVESPVKLDAGLASFPEASHFSETTEPPSFTGVLRPSSPTKSFEDTPGRLSSQSNRPDIYSSHSYGGPRVRLGPRPSAEIGGRPRTSAGTAPYRPVSTIPAGLKPAAKGSKKDRPQEQDDNMPESPVKEEADPFPSSAAPETESKVLEDDAARPHTSSGASQVAVSPSPFKLDFSTMVAPPAQQKQNTMTPEKARLLKAMKLREKKKLMSLQPVPNPPEIDRPPAPASPGLAAQIPDLDGAAFSPESNAVEAESDDRLENTLSFSKSDSGIGIDVGADQASVDTHTDSHPASPMAISDIGNSTKASSVSDSTDETVLAAKDESVAGTDSAIGSPSISGNDDDVAEEETPEPVAAPTEQTEPDELEPQITQQDEQPEDNLVEEVGEKETDDNVTPSAAEAEATASVDAGEPSDITTPEEETAQLPQIRIPVSKFSTHESKSPTSASSQTIPSIVVPSTDVEAEPVAKSDVAVQTDKIGVTEDILQTAPTEVKRPKSMLEPLMLGRGHQDREKRLSVTSLSDDDRLMDELQSATVQQAKPITVSKSPISPFFPSDATLKRSNTGGTNLPTPRIVRTVSSPTRGSLLAPADVSTNSARSASSGSAFLQKVAQQQAAAELKPKSNKIGSSISQRIKALQELSGSTGPPEAVPKERPSSTFFSVRKTSVREPSRSPSVAERANSMTRKSPSPPGSNESSPETGRAPRRDRTGSMVSRLSVFEGGKPPRGRPESIQVTARIVRDPNQPFPKVFESKADPGDFSPLDLKQSPLLVDVQKTAPTPSPAPIPNPPEQEAVPERKPSLLQRRFSKGRRSQSEDRNTESAKEEDKESTEVGRPRRRSSMTIVKDFIKDRRDSIIGTKSPSTDNLSLNISSGQLNLASPALTTSSRSPSRPPSTHHNSIFPRRLSIGSRRSSIDQKSPAPSTSGLISAALSPPYGVETGGESEAEGRAASGTGEKRTGSASSSSDGGSTATSPTSKNNSRTSRFMRRLSNTLVSGRKATAPSISPTVTEEDAAEVEAARGSKSSSSGGQVAGTPQTPSIVAYMGDVNVQFPDNLLWKRRAMCLDSQGFLILSAVQGTAAAMPAAMLGKDRHHQAGMIKRYHMSDFKMPYTPEIEVQELPNSVVLDFVEGSGLQVACEDRAGQLNVLHILEEAHRSHTNFGQ